MSGLGYLSWRRQRWMVLAALALVAFYACTAAVRSPLLAGMVMRAGAFVEPGLVLPLFFGACWAAPLLAREQQHGTVDLAYTQSVSRLAWLVAWVAPVLVAAVAAAVAISVAFELLIEPGESYAVWYGGLAEAPARIGYVLLAVSIGLFAGAVIGRTVPAVAATVAGFLTLPYAVRIAVVGGDFRVEPAGWWKYWFDLVPTGGTAAVLLVAAAVQMTRRVPA